MRPAFEPYFQAPRCNSSHGARHCLHGDLAACAGLHLMAQLAAVQEALDEVIRQEIERLEAPGCVFLGGVSQGCNVALDAYLRHDLGGFAGSVGFLPGDSWGFEGADRRLRTGGNVWQPYAT
eukprot:g33306.t1